MHLGEDVFQATFMALARQAVKIRRPEALAGWLYNTGRRIALKARASSTHRTLCADPQVPDPRPDPLSQLSVREALQILDEELQRLPEHHRLAIVLCSLDGKSHEQAARRLGCTTGDPAGATSTAAASKLHLIGLEQARADAGPRSSGLLATFARVADAAAAGMTTALLAKTVTAAQASGGLSGHGRGYSQLPLRHRGWKELPCPTGTGVFSTKLLLAPVFVLALVTVAGSVFRYANGVPPTQISAEIEVTQAPGRPPERVDAQGDPLPADVLTRLGTIRLQHGASPRAIAFAPDGRSLATAGMDPVVRVWATSTGKELLHIENEQFPSSLGAVWSLSYSPDASKTPWRGTRLNQPVCLWDASSGKELRMFGGARHRAYRIAFSPDGKTLAYGGAKDDPVHLASVGTGQELHLLGGHKGFVNQIAFAPDGQTLATVDDDTIRLFDVATGKGSALPRDNALTERFTELAFSPDGKTFAVSSDERRIIRLLDVATGKVLHSISLPTKWEQLIPIAFTPDGKTLISGHADGFVRMWDTHTGALVRSVRVYSQIVIALALSPDGKTLATSSNSNLENGVRLWEFASGNRLIPFPGPNQAVTSVIFSPDGRHVATSSSEIHLWEAHTGKLLRIWNLAGPLAFTPDGTTLICGGARTGKVHCLDLTNGAADRPFQAHPKYLGCLDLSSDGKILATADYDGSLKLWDPATGQLLHEIGGQQKEPVWKVALSPDGGTLASIYQDAWARRSSALESTKTDTAHPRTARTSDFIEGIAFSPDGRLLATICREAQFQMSIRFREVLTGKETNVLPLKRAHRGHDQIAYSPDGRTVFWAGPDGKILYSGKQPRDSVWPS